MGERLRLELAIERWPLSRPFRISGFTFEHSEVVVATLSDGRARGRGEASGVYYHGDTPAGIVETLEAHRDLIESGVTRDALREAMPPCGARNAIDCALWELEAARSGKPVWRIALGAAPRPLLTTCTVGADTPEVMAEGARANVGSAGDQAEADRRRARTPRASPPCAKRGRTSGSPSTPTRVFRWRPCAT